MEIRIVLNSPGIAAFLKTDPGIQADLERRANAVKHEADGKIQDPPSGHATEHHKATVWVGSDRQRATIRTSSREARISEAENHTLLSSLDAARSP
jgi:hypothetical protein